MKKSQKKEASLQDTHILIIIFLSILWFSDNQDLGNLIKIYNKERFYFSLLVWTLFLDICHMQHIRHGHAT